jgi:hypothetical protein
VDIAGVLSGRLVIVLKIYDWSLYAARGNYLISDSFTPGMLNSFPAIPQSGVFLIFEKRHHPYSSPTQFDFHAGHLNDDLIRMIAVRGLLGVGSYCSRERVRQR